MRTKVELLAALEASRDEVVAGLDGLDLSAGVYEGGWNGRQLLAHIASMEWTYPRILELPAATDEEAARPRDTSVTVDDYNRRQVEKRDAVPVDDLIDEFVRNRARTIDAVAAHPEDEFRRRVRSAGGTVGSLADVLWFVAIEHVRGHLADLRGT
jgi:mycothiol maleylpyruvate isomerase-like protein